MTEAQMHEPTPGQMALDEAQEHEGERVAEPAPRHLSSAPTAEYGAPYLPILAPTKPDNSGNNGVN